MENSNARSLILIFRTVYCGAAHQEQANCFLLAFFLSVTIYYSRSIFPLFSFPRFASDHQAGLHWSKLFSFPLWRLIVPTVIDVSLLLNVYLLEIIRNINYFCRFHHTPFILLFLEFSELGQRQLLALHSSRRIHSHLERFCRLF